MKKAFYLLFVCFFACCYLHAQSVKELENQRKATLKQLETTSKLLNETKNDEKVSLNKLNILKRNISDRKTLIKNINVEINALNLEMNALNLRKNELEQELQLLKDDYAILVRETHYAQTQNKELLFLLSSDSFDQMIRRLRYLQEFTAYRKRQIAQIEAITNDIAIQNELLLQNKQSKEEVLQLKEREHEKLARDERKEQLMLNELKKKEKDLLAQQKKQQKKADELNNRIAKLIEEEIRKAEAKKVPKSTTTNAPNQTSAVSTLTKEEALIAGGFEKNKGRLPWPTEKGFVSGQFGVQPHSVLQHVTINNKGIYIQTPTGSSARAVFEGEVTQCFSIPGSNNAVIVKHGNYRTVYANLTKILVKEGDKVKPKQAIGIIYSDPDNDNKTELYFQIWKDKAIENPSYWLVR